VFNHLSGSFSTSLGLDSSFSPTYPLTFGLRSRIVNTACRIYGVPMTLLLESITWKLTLRRCCQPSPLYIRLNLPLLIVQTLITRHILISVDTIPLRSTMAAIAFTTLLLLFHNVSASPSSSAKPFDKHCKQLDIPVFAAAPSAIYDVPRVNSDIEATAWAIYDATRNTPHGVQNIIRNTTTSGTFNIHAQLCIPKSSRKKDILQIATHGVHYDSRYWDSKYQPEQHSYVDATLRAGYSILTYDRLGVGQSDHPDAYDVVQAPLELEILRQLTLMARNGTLYSFAQNAKPADEVFSQVTKPSKVVHLGHSFGSFLTSAFIAKYGNLTDGAIITGYLPTQYLASAGSTTFSIEYAATSSPPFDRPSGYVVCKKNGIQNIFFGGDPKNAFTPELLNYGNEIKQPVPIGEFASAFWLFGNYGPSFRAPVQYLLPEFDFYICRGDCNELANVTTLAQTYPNAKAIEVVIQPNTGHALPLHSNATAGFQLTYDFLARHGL
jgi:pimeloyl-ACP methyl ester carboxylesterase